MIRFCLAFLLLLAASAASAQETRIAAVVNDDVISMGDLGARLRLVFASSNIQDTPEVRQRLAPQVLRAMIDEKLELQEAKRLKVTVSQKEIDRALSRIEQQNHLPKGGLDKYLDARGLDRSSLIDQITASLAWTKVVQGHGNLVTPISDEEVTDTLNQMRADEGQPRVRVAEIYLAVDNPQQDDEVHKFADRLYDQLRQGANFSALAQQFSQSATAAVGGDLGWMTPSQLDNDVAPVVQHLGSGQAAPPIRVAGGYKIVLLIERQGPGGSAPDDTHVSLVQIMFPLATNAAPAAREKAMAQAEKVSQEAKSCGEMIQLGHELAPRTSGDLGQVKIGDLPAEIRHAVMTLKIAEPSKPMPLRGGVGVLMVCSRDREITPTAPPTREEVADDLARARFDNLARRYLRDLRRAAFVDIRR